MKWFIIPKDTYPKPATGKYYHDWKEHLSKEGQEQCVYCAIQLSIFGGLRNFHVEHYRPKSIERFKHLEHDYANLFFACSICNGFKGADWRAEPDEKFENSSYPDPSKIDYSQFLKMDSDFKLYSDHFTGKYVIEKLYLNRPQLILERKSYYLHFMLLEECNKTLELAKQKQENSGKVGVDPLSSAIEVAVSLIKGRYVNPYVANQIVR